MPEPLLLALLVAAVASGWWLGRRERQRSSHRGQQAPFSRDYFVGLNYLLNDQPDRAIETFVRVLEVDSDTIETHITLGNLFRSRGEADRAVKIHQNLLARPVLTPAQGDQVQLELARDFLQLGVHDRAERLLQQLIRDSGDALTRQSAKRLLVDLFERERDWQQALDVAVPQLARQDESIRRAAAHWLCELARQDLNAISPSMARRRLRQALSTDEQCVRANWLLAGLEREAGNYKAEIRLLQRIPDQDPDFMPLILPALRSAYLKLEDDAGLERYLRQLNEASRHTGAAVMLAKIIERREGQAAAAAFAARHLTATPSLRGLDYLLELYLQETAPDQQNRATLLKEQIARLHECRPQYCCQRCGFSGAQLHWQCPRCRNWGSVKPLGEAAQA